MSIDPARLARIRARLLAAAAVTAAAGCASQPYINDRPPDIVNDRRPEADNVAPVDNPPPTDPTTEPTPDVNTPPPEPTTATPDKPTPHHVNTPKPPDPSQTINTSPNPR